MKIKYVIFALISFLISLTICLGVVLAIDLYCHEKFSKYAGLNYRGYRGKVVGKKANDEIRMVMVGGSFVFGYNAKADETLPAQLEKKLQKKYNKNITVVNLGYNTEGAYAFYYNLRDFLYLDYNYVIISGDYNDVGTAGNTRVYRHENPIFRIFGYMPILPLVAREKAMALKTGGRLEDAYWGRKVVFTPNTKDKIKIAILEGGVKIYDEFEKRADFIKKSKIDFNYNDLKKDRWLWYKYFMKKTIDFALDHKRKVIVITQPYIVNIYVEYQHQEQQEDLKDFIEETYKDRVQYLNMGKAISLQEPTLAGDGMHLTLKGSETLAGIIAEEIQL